jgi:hypothetical protein
MAAGGFTSGIVRPIAKLVMSWNDANAKYRWCTRSSLVPVRRTDDFCGPDRRVLGNDHLTRAASSEKRLLAIGHAAAPPMTESATTGIRIRSIVATPGMIS